MNKLMKKLLAVALASVAMFAQAAKEVVGGRECEI